MPYKNILVDLLPVLPGGLNGGAKVMVLDLLKTMCQLAPETQWTLLIQPGVEQDLSALNLPNVNFYKISKSPFSLSYRFPLLLLNKMRQHLSLPNFIYGKLFKQLEWLRIHTTPKLKGVVYDLLFCPFTDPVFHQKNIPTVSIIYDLQYLSYPMFFSFDELLHRNQVIKHACSKASKLVAISDYSKNRTLETQKLSENKIKAIPISLSKRLEDKLNPSKTLEKYQLIAQKYLIYPANFWKHKNHEMLLLAFQQAIREANLDIKLVLTGAPCERQKFLKNAVEKQGLSDRVIFLDYVSNDELASLLKNSLALIFPSLYEGFGMPIVEAMALGVPVLCSNVTSLPEVAGDAAILFTPQSLDSMKKAIMEVYENHSQREEMIHKGYQQAKQFSDVHQMAKDYLDVLESV